MRIIKTHKFENLREWANAATNTSVNFPTFWVRNTSPQIYNPPQMAFFPNFSSGSSNLTCNDNGLNEEQFLAA